MTSSDIEKLDVEFDFRARRNWARAGMVEWNGIFRLFRFSGILGQPLEVHLKFRDEIPKNVCSIRSLTWHFRNIWSNGNRPWFSSKHFWYTIGFWSPWRFAFERTMSLVSSGHPHASVTEFVCTFRCTQVVSWLFSPRVSTLFWVAATSLLPLGLQCSSNFSGCFSHFLRSASTIVTLSRMFWPRSSDLTTG